MENENAKRHNQVETSHDRLLPVGIRQTISDHSQRLFFFQHPEAIH